MTSMERVLMTFLLDANAAFHEHGTQRETLTGLEQDVQRAMQRCLHKLHVVTVLEPGTLPMASQGGGGLEAEA